MTSRVLDPVDAIVTLLTQVLELKKRIDLDPEHALAAEPLFRAIQESLSGLYRLMLGLPKEEGSRMRSAAIRGEGEAGPSAGGRSQKEEHE